MPPEVFLALDKALKANCFEVCPDLTTHDSVGFWKGFAYAVKVMKEANVKKGFTGITPAQSDTLGERLFELIK